MPSKNKNPLRIHIIKGYFVMQRVFQWPAEVFYRTPQAVNGGIQTKLMML